MKIDASLAFPENVGPQRVGTSGTSPTQNQADTVGLTSDEVQFSVDGDKVQQLTTEHASLPDVRQENVATLSQAIEQGSYTVTDAQIAQAMSSELLGKVS